MKDEKLYLEHILESAEKIQKYSSAGREKFMKDTLLQDGVVRNFEIIGEAAKRLSSETRSRHPEIPWQDVARFRDVLIHHYMGVDLKRVWNTIETRLPALQKAVKDLLEE